MADANEVKNQRRLKIKRLRERIERLLQRALIGVDFYASIAAQLERANRQIDEGQRSDEFNQEDLADQRVKNKVGDEGKEEDGEQPEPEEPEPEQQEQSDEEERRAAEREKRPEGDERQRLPEEHRRPRTPQRTVRPTKAPAPTPTTAGRTAVVARGAALFASPTTWIVIAVILVLLLLVGLVYLIFGGVGNKALDAAGGSIPIALNFDNKDHQILVANILKLKQEGKLLIPDKLAKDLDWQSDKDGKAIHTLDWRTMEALRYLGNKWPVVGVKILRSNGPDMTRRKSAAKGEEETEPIDAPSAYQFGQGIAIDRLGLTSPELTEAMGLDASVPVRISWQKTMRENSLRGLYEQLQVDARALFSGAGQAATQADTDARGLATLARVHGQSVADAAKDPRAKIADNYTRALTALDNLLINLQRLREQGGLDDRTISFTAPALANLQNDRANLDKGGTDFIAEWGKSDTIAVIRKGLQAVFRAMQVANMSGWRGNTKEIKLWQAYEARQNIRQLVLDLLRMPVELAGEGNDFNGDLVVRQLIVYSPEDDLDNGLPDFDVYPKGATSVDEGGVGYDPSAADKKIDTRDNHFMALPIDNGVFSKGATIFIYKVQGAGEWAAELAEGLIPGLRSLYDQYDGGGVERIGEDNVRVSYRNFVHIGF